MYKIPTVSQEKIIFRDRFAQAAPQGSLWDRLHNNLFEIY